MEVEDESSGCGSYTSDGDITPPSSPVLGYSRGEIGEDNFDHEDVLYCFNCKGVPRLSDQSFDPNSLILRRELINCIEQLHDEVNTSNTLQPAFRRFFDTSYDPRDSGGCNILLKIVRRDLHTLQILSDPKRTERGRDFGDVHMEGEDTNSTPWTLRKGVLQFFNYLTRHVQYYRGVLWRSEEDLESMFASFKDAFGNVQNCWESYLKCFTGRRDGNDALSPVYHLFHAMLEIRWSLLIIYRMSRGTLLWVMEDLVHLAWDMFEMHEDVQGKVPYNCSCVKELWTMIRLLCEELEINFWSSLEQPLAQFRNSEEFSRKVHFPLWLLSHLNFLSDYCLNGVYMAGREIKEPFKYKGYFLVNPIVKDWIADRQKECEVYYYLLQFVNYWGWDSDLLVLLWNYWLPKINKIEDVKPTCMESFSSVEKWVNLVKEIANSKSVLTQRQSEIHQFISQDAFLSFLKLVVAHAVAIGSEKEWKKFTSIIASRLSKSNVASFGEIGLIRVSTLFLTLASGTSDTISMTELLRQTLEHGKPSPERTKRSLRATTCGIYILLIKEVPISNLSIFTSYMKTVDMHLASVPLDNVKKEYVMIYMDLLDMLPNTPTFSEQNMGREGLVSLNLTVWLASLACDQNYLVRTLRVLNSLTNWTISSKISNPSTPSTERDGMCLKLFERTSEFLMKNVIAKKNRIPSTDIEPMASLAADLTVLSKWMGHRTANGPSSASRLFNHFALNELVSPEISQHYAARLLPHEEQLGEAVTELKWCQTWIRLIVLNCTVPEELTEKVIGPGFTSTSNHELLKKFCGKSEEWSRGDVQNMLQPLPVLLKAAVSGGGSKDNAAPFVSSVVRGAAKLLKHMNFEKIYFKSDSSSIASTLLKLLLPPFVGVAPWEALPKPALLTLRNLLFDIFLAIIDNSELKCDQFLQRKLQDLLTLAVLGYAEDTKDMNEEHPGIKILQHAEDVTLSLVLDQCLTGITNNLKSSAEDPKLARRYTNFVMGLTINKFTTSVMRFLPGILYIFVNRPASPTDIPTACLNIINYCCTFGLLTPFDEQMRKAFDSEMEAQFSNKSKRFFDITSFMLKRARNQGKKFLKLHLLPLYTRHVSSSEQKRGTGTDRSLRNFLDTLERDSVGFENLPNSTI